MNASRFALALLSFGVVTLAGCNGNRTAEVSGSVTLKGEPLAAAVITFFPENGQPVAAYVQNGLYAVPALAYGNHRVSITPQQESPEVGLVGGKPAKPGEVDPSAKGAKNKKAPPASPIPTKYLSADTSQLTCTIDKPQVTQPFTLD